ncbi:MAG: hypothetical protein ACFFEV_07165 [Candidatus Thorarchaeota archaeon]
MNTPNTIGLLKMLQENTESELIMHKDSIEEALLQFQQMQNRSRWSEDPAYRARWLAVNLKDSELNKFRFPGDAFRLLIGGNVGPPFFGYLNYTRLCGFLYASLLDKLNYFQEPKMVLLELADSIDNMRKKIMTQINKHKDSREIVIDTNKRYTCWGPFYMRESLEFNLKIIVFEDTKIDREKTDAGVINFANLRKFDESGKRDAYHYAMMVTANEQPDFMLVADSGFKKQVRNHLGERISQLIPIKRSNSYRPDTI